MCTYTFLLLRRFTALSLLVLAGTLTAGQKPAKKTTAPAPAAPPLASPEPAAPLPQIAQIGTPIRFSIPPAAEFQIQVPDDAARLDLQFQIDSGPVDASLGSARASDGNHRPEYAFSAMTGTVSGSISPDSFPPLRHGTYYLRLSSNEKAASGSFVAAATPATITNEVKLSSGSSLMAFIKAPPPWFAAALSVASLLCLGLLFLHGIRSARILGSRLESGLGSLGVVAESLQALKKSVDHVPQATAEYRTEVPASAQRQPQASAVPLAGRVRLLLSADPILVTARLVRDVARRAGGDAEKEFGRNFAGYMEVLDQAERTLAEAPDGSAGREEQWVALHRAIGALQARHNPRFFLDVIDEAGSQHMPQKQQLLEALGIEEMTPSVGTEIPDLTAFQIERTEGMGRRPVLESVIRGGYRFLRTGEVYRKPAITVRLESSSTTAA